MENSENSKLALIAVVAASVALASSVSNLGREQLRVWDALRSIGGPAGLLSLACAFAFTKPQSPVYRILMYASIALCTLTLAGAIYRLLI